MGKKTEDVADSELVRAKLWFIHNELSNAFAQRHNEIEALIVAAVAGAHVLLLGPPGTSKSALVRAWTSAISGATYFETLLTRYSTPEEVFGPVSVRALKEDRYERVAAGKLPEAHVAFLDEIWKANSAILNSLLTIVNERLWHNGATPVKVPLLSLVGASNEMPAEDGLAALYDRFALRLVVSELAGQEDFMRLVRGELGGNPTSSITLDELRIAQAEARAVRVTHQIAERMFTLKLNLAKEGVSLSGRRWVTAMSVLKANAWRMGHDTVSEEHFDVLSHVLWEKPEHREAVATVVGKMASPWLVKARDLHDAAMEKFQTVPERDDGTWLAKATSAHQALKGAAKRVKEALDGAIAAKASDVTVESIRELGRELQATAKSIRATLTADDEQEVGF